MIVQKHWMTGLMTLAGAGAASVLLALPVNAQVNPNPSIFNEPPFNGQPGPSTGLDTPGMGMDPGLQPTSPTPGTAPGTLSPGATPGTMTPGTPQSAANIVDVAASSGSFRTLTQALQVAGLTDVLSGQGPYTVFAPTDEAFAALPPGTVEQLLLPENRDLLVRLLAYHVVPGEVMSTDLSSGEVSTVEGTSITVQTGQAGVTVNDATVIQPDIPASNGVIHAIDRVILPPDS